MVHFSSIDDDESDTDTDTTDSEMPELISIPIVDTSADTTISETSAETIPILDTTISEMPEMPVLTDLEPSLIQPYIYFLC